MKDVFPDNGRDNDAGYGYQWWVPEHDGENPAVFGGNGYGYQLLYVVPEHDLVAVFNAWDIHEVASGAPIWFALQDRIIPAIGSK